MALGSRTRGPGAAAGRAGAAASGGRRAAGDTDIAAVGALVADRGRCQILLALGDGRALPASRLAAEAGVSPATASSHLGKLTGAGLLTVEAHGRHRYYKLAGPAVANLLEAIQQLAPAAPVRSLRQGTRAHLGQFGVRIATHRRLIRYCIDWSEQHHHLSGALGRGLLDRFLELGWIRPSGDSRAVHLTETGRDGMSQVFGVSPGPSPAP